MRNLVGSLLAVLGAAATLVSPWRAWYNGRHGSTYKFYEVFGSGITGSKSGVMDSVFLVFLVTTVMAVAGVVLQSRVLVGAAGVVAFGFGLLWMIRQGQAAGELTISSDNRGLGVGVANALGGGLLMIIGAVLMTGRPRTTTADAGGKPVAAAAPARKPESNAIPTNPPTPSAPARPVPPAPAAGTERTASERTGTEPTGSERTGTERLSKEEREMLGLDEDAPAPKKPEN